MHGVQNAHRTERIDILAKTDSSLTALHNQREKTRGAKLIIHMSGNQTAIMDPAVLDKGGEPKKFSFDYSYWSHDGFQERDNGYLDPTSSKYADQVRINITQAVQITLP